MCFVLFCRCPSFNGMAISPTGGVFIREYPTGVENSHFVSFGMAIAPTGGVFSYLPHHQDLASED